MANLYDVFRTVQRGLEPVVANGEFSSCQESQNGRFAHSGVSDDDDGFVAVGVFGDASDAVFDHLLDLQ